MSLSLDINLEIAVKNMGNYCKFCKKVLDDSLWQWGGAEGAESRATRLSAEELTEILQSAVAAAHELSMELDFTSPGWLPEQTLRALGLHLIPSCGACLSNMAVAPDGTVIPCQSWLGGTALGNILTDDWDKIWQSQRCAAIRAKSAKMEQLCQLLQGNGKEASVC